MTDRRTELLRAGTGSVERCQNGKGVGSALLVIPAPVLHRLGGWAGICCPVPGLWAQPGTLSCGSARPGSVRGGWAARVLTFPPPLLFQGGASLHRMKHRDGASTRPVSPVLLPSWLCQMATARPRFGDRRGQSPREVALGPPPPAPRRGCVLGWFVGVLAPRWGPRCPHPCQSHQLVRSWLFQVFSV